MDDIVIYPKKTKLLALAVGALVFVVLSVFLTQNHQGVPFPPWVIIGVSYCGIAFFGFCLGYAIYRLFVPKPAVVISREGIFDNASAVGAGMLRWEEIAKVFPYDFMGQRMLGIIPVNEEAIIMRQSRIKRVMARMNRGMVSAPFNIPQSVLPISIDELLVKIQNRWRDSSL